MARTPQKRVGDETPETVLTHVRILLGISQIELGKKLNLSQPLISYYENGLAVPEKHAKLIMGVFRALCPPEHQALIDSIQPSDLPRAWESFFQETVSTRNTDEENNSTLDSMVA